jgi:hypothetical protein
LSGVASSVAAVLPLVLRCDATVLRKVRYVFDTLFQAAGIPIGVCDAPPDSGPWLLYADTLPAESGDADALFVAHCPAVWRLFDGQQLAGRAASVEGLEAVFPQKVEGGDARHGIGFDIIANAFYFLSSWAERVGDRATSSRQLHSTSEFVRLGVPQDIVDRYLARLLDRLRALCDRIGAPMWPLLEWPGGKSFAVVLSHDVDFLPVRPLDNATQGAKTVLRHLVRQRDPADAWRAATGWLAATGRGRDPYGCVPEIIAREQALGVRSSFQVAVGHRHPNDVNYRIEDDKVRDYLSAITAAGFDLCLHGSYRSTENPQWYVDEAELLSRRLARPLGSRQHFLSFDYDHLFAAQEQAGIEYDMSMGFPDRTGPRAGFSYPYFPYNLSEDRPYRVLQISLFLMDVTLRGYMGLRPEPAGRVIGECLAELRDKRGGVSAVWHPIVFGGARDPGYDRLYFDMVVQIGAMGGLATDGRTVNTFWRAQARHHASFT